MNTSTKSNNLSIDLLTILGIGIVSFILKNVIHEELGHGGACLLVAVHLLSFPQHTSTVILH